MKSKLISNCLVTGYEVGTLIDGSRVPGKKNQVGRIKFGTESSGGFRNVTITNCIFHYSKGLSLQSVDGVPFPIIRNSPSIPGSR